MDFLPKRFNFSGDYVHLLLGMNWMYISPSMEQKSNCVIPRALQLFNSFFKCT